MVSDRPGGFGGQDIYVTRRASINDPWGPLQNLGARINSSANDFCPFITPDGHKFLFLSNRPGGPGIGDFYMAFRRNNLDDLAWDDVQIVPELNTAADEFGPSGYEDPDTGVLTIYFNSDRPGGAGASDIYTSTLGPDGKFTAPQRVAELNTSGTEQWPVVRLDGLEMFFTSNRSGTVGGNDLWVTTRGSVSEPWSTPVNLGPVVNTAGVEGRSWIYAGGARLLYFSNRSGGVGGNDLWETSRTRTSLIPVAGSVTGVGGTTFRTFAQLTNPSASAISGSLWFHPAGQSASANDARISYTLAPFETRTYADLMAAFGTQGIGSVEVVPATGPPPASVVRVDNGGSVIIPQVGAEDVLWAGSRGVLTTPSDLSRFRMNVGVRTFSSAATMTITLHDASGGVVRTASRSFPPNYFIHMTAPEFVGGSIAAGQSIVVAIDSGSAVVYGSTTSNTGQGSTIQIASRIVP